MKKLIISLLAIAGLVVCGKAAEKTTITSNSAPAEVNMKPWQDYQALLDSTLARLENASDRDLIIDEYIQRSYQILIDNINNVATDSIILDLFYNLSDEQKAKVVKLLAPERWQNNEGMQSLYSKYQAELLTAPGNQYIDVQALQQNGKAVRLSELVGKADYLLVDFWASWCRPCRQLIPHLKDLHAKYHQSGKLQIVGISVDRDRNAWLQALQEEQMAWLQLHDTHEAPNNPSDTYGISAIPTTLLIDRNGTIVLRNPSEEEIAEILDK
jgi:thiol-disulfide isomerase/thioredoxin